MGENTGIQWTENTWNPWHGCTKVSAGCKYCYMYRDKERYGQDPFVVIRSKANFNQPLKWKEPKIIFTCSWSDWFIEEADQWREEAWKIIKNTPHHTYQILTKRPERILSNLPKDWGAGYPNVWLGISAEDNPNFISRMFFFAEVPAKVKFLSAEPLIGEIDMGYLLNEQYDPKDNCRLDWVIIGGESGNKTGKYLYRKCQLHWIENILTECQKFKIPVFVKQLGTHVASEQQLNDSHGGDINEFPENLKVRQMPVNL